MSDSSPLDDDPEGHDDPRAAPAEGSVARYELPIAAADGGQRLDQFLSRVELPFSRSQIKRHIEAGYCEVNGEVARPARKLREGDVVRYAPPAPASYERVEPEAIPLDVLFEDEHLIVVDKPPGMVVHPAPGHPRGTLVAALLAHCETLSGVGGLLRPGIVHRLDRLTSGVMVASKSDAAHEGLAKQFERHSIERRYLAIVRGAPRPASGRIETLHGRHPVDRKRYTTRVERGRAAITHYRTLQVLDGATLVEARLETGRTHQVRVHFAERGHPLLGDPVYGGRQGKDVFREQGRALARQALHAQVLAFEHPLRGDRLSFRTPPPDDMRRALAALGGDLGALEDQR